MIVIVIAAVALVLAFAASVATGRDAVVAGVGVLVFAAVGTYQATGGDEGDGEPINGVAGYFLWLAWLLVPWLLGVLAARLVRARARADS